MKCAVIFVMYCSTIPLVSSAEPAESDSPAAQTRIAPSRAWLGLKLIKPEASITAHVPALPPGMGFLVKSVDPNGPAETAGLHGLDLVWKLDDQLLVNEAQLAALLRIAQPGKEVVISGFRRGMPFESKLTLGAAPISQKPISGKLSDEAATCEPCDRPMRVINVSEKTASVTAVEGKATVWREAGVFHAKIVNSADEVIFEGSLADSKRAEVLTKTWERNIQILCRTLDYPLDGTVVSQRQPRPRVVPQPAEEP